MSRSGLDVTNPRPADEKTVAERKWRAPTEPPGTRPVRKPAPEAAASSSPPTVADTLDDTLDIRNTSFARQVATPASPEALRSQQAAIAAATKKKRAAARKAKDRDTLAKAPLTGKAALTALRD